MIKLKNKKMYGLSYYDKEVLFLWRYRYFSIYLIDKKKRKKLNKIFGFTRPSINQCIYSLNPNRNRLKNFFGLIINR